MRSFDGIARRISVGISCERGLFYKEIVKLNDGLLLARHPAVLASIIVGQ
mgnify:CR=1 FL=1